MVWIDLTQNRDRWRAVVNAVIKHQFPLNARDFFSGQLRICQLLRKDSALRTLLVGQLFAQLVSWLVCYLDRIQRKVSCQLRLLGLSRKQSVSLAARHNLTELTVTCAIVGEWRKQTRQPRGFILIRQNQSRNLEVFLLKWVIRKARKPEWRFYEIYYSSVHLIQLTEIHITVLNNPYSLTE